MKLALSYSLILSGFINPCLASNQPLDDDEALKIAIALSLAEEQRVIEEAAASAIPEMRRPHSLPKTAASSSFSQCTQLDDDAAIAQALYQADLDAQQKNGGNSKEQLDADFALALSLDKENDPFKQKPMPSPQDQFFIPEAERPKLQAMAAAYIQILRSNPVAGLDVHAFNRAFVIPNREAVLAINKQLKLKEDNSLDTMITEFQTNNVNTPHLARALGMLKAYIANNRVDAETGLTLTQIISWNYELAKNVHRYSDNTLFCMPNGDHVSALNYMARSLDENINEQGGCLPGFMGRMFDVNFHFLCELAGVKIA